jgi:mannose-6-phosphate isomerase-like protein (cupin superfamily)
VPDVPRAAPEALDPTSTYLHLPEGPGVRAIPVTEDFWSTIDEQADLRRGRLVTSFDQAADWTVWEMHPEDEEIIVQVSGETTFHLDVDGVVTQVPTGPGEVVVVPRGTWHTADVRQPGRILVITWGEGTAHRPR